MSYPRRSVRLVRSAVRLATGPEFTLRVVACQDDHRGWSAPEERIGHELVLVRRGRFRRRVRGEVADVDPTVGYLSAPGDEERFAHPSGGDLCTSICVGEGLWPAEGASSVLYVDAQLDLAHRRLLAATRSGDVDYALVEQLLVLLSGVLDTVTATGGADDATGSSATAPGRPNPSDATGSHPRTATRSAGRVPEANARNLAARARAAILDADPAAHGLLPLAAHLGVSPYRLSRVFTREMGVSLTRYRNRVRVGRALDRLEAGEPNLALLAAELGFADQAHLTRTVRAHVGRTPAALRRLLDPPTSRGPS